MVLTPSTMLPLGTTAPAFSLPNVDGESVSLADFKGAPAYLVVFMCNHCPYVKHVAAELARLGRDYQAKGVAMVGINSNDVGTYPADSPEQMVHEEIPSLAIAVLSARRMIGARDDEQIKHLLRLDQSVRHLQRR